MIRDAARQDIRDLKPDAPSDTRGEFKPIPSYLPGLYLGGHIPRTTRSGNNHDTLGAGEAGYGTGNRTDRGVSLRLPTVAATGSCSTRARVTDLSRGSDAGQVCPHGN